MRWCLSVAFLCASAVHAQQLPVQEFTLDNGLKVLLLPRPGSSVFSAGWIAKAGSVNERPGITGISHLFEHMMFKGTTTIGTKNIEEDLKVNNQLDTLKGELRKEEQELSRRVRLGEIADAKDPKVRTPRHQQLMADFDRLTQRSRELQVKQELDRIYTSQGATGMNAGTSHDYTIYFVTLPANKIELWFWLESDRLLNPVFREFYAERDVVHEERRMRLDSTPTGRYFEQFEAMFWKASPYGWPVVGWPSDLEAVTREDASDYYARYYAPNNLAVCLVGDFNAAQAREMAQKYFGRLRRGLREPEPVRTVEPPQIGEQRMAAQAETLPQVTIRYHSVADGHLDEPALVVLGEMLNGRTGRLYRSLVLEQQLANMASAGQNGLKYEGYFQFSGVAKPGKTPEQVEQAIYKEIEKLQSEPVSEHELQKIKNLVTASSYRQLQQDSSLMMRLLIAESGLGWKTLLSAYEKMQRVTAQDIQRVAKKYFTQENRNVLVFYSKRGAKAAAGGSN